MCRSLLPHQKLEDLKQEARSLLHDLRTRDAAAVARYLSLDPLADMFQPRLADAQYLIAREYGCQSWEKLKECLDGSSQDPR
jgi:hypothetical protein